ncbi:Uu.00g014930.m01.CDS01 [Anthostomella pinea]|uniref:Uu.00g014930.m01.CDS01 n=1 Tax=Anthostomella pinea TaxID=933095 RepID=A0AAI8VYE7_9PEZI|nr:Uu.00g014930.m01.CDS01 [Anthostomella pinea]
MSVSTHLPTSQRAIVASDKLDYCIREDVPLPPIRHDSVIIKTEAVSLNPVDTKMVGPFVTPGAIYGTDASGVVVAIGAVVASSNRLKIGDRVCGATEGMEGLRPQSGTFAEYVSLDGGMALKMPDNMSFEVGAGMGLRIATSGMALFYSLGIPAQLLKTPAKEPFDVLVYGGATATGTMAIQLLKRCGLRVITTCSPRNFDLVKSYGADECFDYNKPACGADIRAFTNNVLDYALDCITEESTIQICYQALGRCAGKYVGLEPYPERTADRRTVRPDWILSSWMRGLPCSWPGPFGTEGMPAAREFATSFFPTIHQMFTAGELREHPTRTETDGFEGLLEGVNLLRKGKVSGRKLVYRTAERRAVAASA